MASRVLTRCMRIPPLGRSAVPSSRSPSIALKDCSWSRAHFAYRGLSSLSQRFGANRGALEEGRCSGISSQRVTCLRQSLPILTSRKGFRSSRTVGVEKQEGKIKPSEPKKRILPYTPHEQIYNIPNFLTLARILATPALGYFILHDQTIPALALLVTAGVTDVLDGWIARKWNLQTVVGSVVDPMADKLLVTVLTVSLAAKGLLPLWLAVIILGRDIGLSISAIWYRWISLPPPKTFMRYWDFSLPSAEVRPTTISKVNTLLQLGLITASTAAPVVPISEMAMITAQYTVAVTTIWSGLSYVFSKNAVKILKQPGDQEENKKE